MTSPGLKRPLDLEIGHNAPKSEQIVGDATVANSNGELRLQPKEVNNDLGSPEVDNSPDRYASTAPNGHKRLCTTTIYPLVPSSDNIKNDNNQIPMSQESTTTSLSPSSPSISPTMRAEIQYTQHQQQQRTHSPINEDIDALIREELHKASEEESQRHQQGMQNGISEPPILTARQTQKICEKMIKIREQRLRDEYDRKLASKLAEQYDLFAKAKYLNTFSEPAQSPATSPVPSTAAATAAAAAVAAAAASSNSSITNAIAAAFMQRSAVSATANPIMSSTTNSVNPVNTTCTAQNLPNLSNLAASLNANGHNNAMAQPHLTASYIRQNAAVALRQAQLQQQLPLQHPMQLQHPLQSHQLQHRNSICSNSSTLPLGPVLLTSNLDEQLAIPEALFTLFGVFGDVVRVKILFNKKDNALVQMADANQAQVAQGYLDKQKIFGKVIRVTRSKHQLVQMPREGNQTDAGLTKDFTNSPLHRFKIPGSRNYLNIYPPSNTLHISNIPAKVDEKDLHKAFKGQCGFEFYSFKFFLKDRKMALMKFNSIEHATIALIKMHNFQISEDNNLRVSFSKSSI